MKDFKQIIAEEIEKATNINKEKILENIPLEMGKVFMQQKYFCVKNIQA